MLYNEVNQIKGVLKMMTQQATTKAREDLNSIISNYAMKDFNQYNRKKDGTYYKKRRPYNLSSETMEAKEILEIALKKNITAEEEEIIKAYLIPYRVFETDLLINTDIR